MRKLCELRSRTAGGRVAAVAFSCAQFVAEFADAQFKQIPDIDAMLDNMLDAIGYGFSAQELIFDTSEGQASLLDVKDCPQELFLFGNRFCRLPIDYLSFLGKNHLCVFNGFKRSSANYFKDEILLNQISVFFINNQTGFVFAVVFGNNDIVGNVNQSSG